MKANKAKSKFVYPDKLYAMTNDNITLDISYAPQTLKAVEYTCTDAFIEKACEFILKYAADSNPYGISNKAQDRLIKEFKKAMNL